MLEDEDLLMDEEDIDYNILCNDVLENFPFIEDDVDSITDYELFSKGFGYLDDKKANKDDIPSLDNYYTKEETNQKLDEKANISDIPDVSDFITKDVDDLTNYYDKDTTDDLLDNKADISDIPDVSDFITKDVDNLTNYTTSSVLTTLLSNKEDISEIGSNANGNYLKMANGVLIQWNKFVVNDQAITGAYGALFQGTRSITFPIPFVGDLPAVQCSEFQYGTSGSWGCVVGNGTTLTGTILRVWECFSRDAGTNCRISWIAIGKWK